MKKLCENCNENLNIGDLYFHKKIIWFNKCKNCLNEKVIYLLRKNCTKEYSLTNHKKRFHTSVVESKDDDIDNDVDKAIDNDVDTDNIIKNYSGNVNRTLVVGPCSCGKTYLIMNKILLIEYDNVDRQIKILARFPSHYLGYETSYRILSQDVYKNYLVVFDDMLENKQKDISPFFLLVIGIKELMFSIYLSVFLSYLY